MSKLAANAIGRGGKDVMAVLRNDNKLDVHEDSTISHTANIATENNI